MLEPLVPLKPNSIPYVSLAKRQPHSMNSSTVMKRNQRSFIQNTTLADGTVSNKTLAALDGFTGDKDTRVNTTMAGKPFHLWTMRDPGFPW